MTFELNVPVQRFFGVLYALAWAKNTLRDCSCLLCVAYYSRRGCAAISRWPYKQQFRPYNNLGTNCLIFMKFDMEIVPLCWSFEDGDNIFLRNVGICLQVDTASQPRTTTSPSSLPCEPQISQSYVCSPFGVKTPQYGAAPSRSSLLSAWRTDSSTRHRNTTSVMGVAQRAQRPIGKWEPSEGKGLVAWEKKIGVCVAIETYVYHALQGWLPTAGTK
jgi:hypothetical protein